MKDWRETFWSKVNKKETCWFWTGSLNWGGYGTFHRKMNGTVLAHRISYMLSVGPIPEGLTLDHLCRVRNCVNPSHLEPVTLAENASRGWEGKERARTQKKCVVEGCEEMGGKSRVWRGNLYYLKWCYRHRQQLLRAKKKNSLTNKRKTNHER